MKMPFSEACHCCRGAPEGGADIPRVRCGELISTRGDLSPALCPQPAVRLLSAFPEQKDFREKIAEDFVACHTDRAGIRRGNQPLSFERRF